jgi:Protein of unknown function (DUF3618)
MAITETARLERETEETRAQLEQTLGELRARMSPGQIFDQAADYFRNGSGRAYLGNLRDEVVRNPLPVTLVGAGIAWLAISSAMGRRRSNGNGHAERDWGETAATAYDLAHGDRRASVAQRAGEMGERVSTAYDETVGAARETAEEWTDEARSAAHRAGDTVREGVEGAREHAGEMYDRTVGGVRRVADKARHYGRTARHAVQHDGALMNFCREQPMLVAGLGIAVGAALGAMLPASQAETRVMGEAGRNVRDKVREVATEALRSATGDDTDSQAAEHKADTRETEGQTRERAASDVERGMEQGSRSPNVEGEPRSAAPYAEAAEAGATGTSTGEDIKPRT